VMSRTTGFPSLTYWAAAGWRASTHIQHPDRSTESAGAGERNQDNKSLESVNRQLHDGRPERGNSVPNHEGTGRMSLPTCKQLGSTSLVLRCGTVCHPTFATHQHCLLSKIGSRLICFCIRILQFNHQLNSSSRCCTAPCSDFTDMLRCLVSCRIIIIMQHKEHFRFSQKW